MFFIIIKIKTPQGGTVARFLLIGKKSARLKPVTVLERVVRPPPILALRTVGIPAAPTFSLSP